MKWEIKCRFSAKVLFECEAESLKLAVELAAEKKAYLGGANLRGANLRGAYLGGAYLGGADLRGADLRGAYLGGADLRGAYLRGAYLRGADLRGAYLRGADLRGAYLRGAYLGGADLRGAYLRGAYLGGADLRGAYLGGADLGGADLRGADLRDIKSDYLQILSVAKHEVLALYKALLEGRIDGSTYTGECACLVGTIANVRNEDHQKLGIDLRPNSDRPAEKWFLNIRQGDTPANNPVAAIVKDWTEEFMNENGIAIPQMKITWSN